jgi:GT2 family glycosyltransferase
MREKVKRPLRFSLSLLSDHLAGAQVIGHVFDEKDLERRFVVELLIDGFSAALGRAERFDADLAQDGFGDGCYGFGFFVDAAALSSACVVEVRLANDGEALGAPLLLQSLAMIAEPLPQSGVARWLGGLRINGWIGEEEGGRRVRALIDGQVVAESFATSWTHVGDGPDVMAAPGFDLHLPLRFADGCAHFAQICDESGRELAGSPVAFVAFEDGLARFLGDRAEIDSEKPRGEIFDRLFPQSLPFSMFAQWRERFETPMAEGGRPKIGVALIGEREIEASVASLEAQQGCEWVAAVLEGGEGELGFPNASLREFLDGDARDCAAVVFAPCGVVFQPQALARLAQALAQFRAAPIAYCDFTFVASDGGEWPVALPAFDYERLLEQGCGALLFALRMDFARDAAASGAADLFRLFQFSQDRRRGENAPVHTPGFLARLPVLDLVSATRLLAQATEAHLRARGVSAKIEPGFGALLPAVRVKRPPPRGKVTLLVPTRDRVDLLQPCIDSLFATVDLARHEVIVLDNDSSDPETLVCFERLAQEGVRVTRIGGPFNFARLVNKGASIASGEFVMVLRDVAAFEPAWLDEMLGRMAEPDVGAVGATLLSPSGVVRHGGFTLGPAFDVAPAFSDRMDGDAGYADLLLAAHEASAVTAACLLTHRRLFLDVGGFDGRHFAKRHHDVDYCLRLRARGLRIVQTPHAKLLQIGGDGGVSEPAERRERETRDLRAIWGEVLVADPYYNPLLSLDQIPFTGLAWPPRPSFPRQNVSPKPRILPPGF